MPINSTDAERQAQADRDLAAKLKLEKPFKPKIRKLLKRMARDLESAIIVTGSPQQAERYMPSWEGLLAEQYENTKTVFSGRLIKQLEEEPEDSNIWKVLLLIGTLTGLNSKREILTMLKADSIVRSNVFIDRSVMNDTVNITRTNAKDLIAATDTARVKLTNELERPPTNTELAKGSRAQFLKHDLGRTETIAATTTQKAAEGMKFLDSQVLGDFRNGSGPLSLGLSRNELSEFWITRGDSIVRLFHRQADGQKKVGGAFIVGGELLRFPGDDELGASISNTINCRCSRVEVYEEQPIPFGQVEEA